MVRNKPSLGSALVGRRPAVSARYLAAAAGLAAVAVGLLAGERTGRVALLLGLLGLAVGLAAVHAYRNGGLAATVAVPVVVTLAPALNALLPTGSGPGRWGRWPGPGPRSCSGSRSASSRSSSVGRPTDSRRARQPSPTGLGQSGHRTASGGPQPSNPRPQTPYR
jgi:hypothetical protein